MELIDTKCFTSSSCSIGSFNNCNTSGVDELQPESRNVMIVGLIGVSIRLVNMDAIRNMTNSLTKTVSLKNFSSNMHPDPRLWRYPPITKFWVPALIWPSQTFALKSQCHACRLEQQLLSLKHHRSSAGSSLRNFDHHVCSIAVKRNSCLLSRRENFNVASR